MKELTRTEAVKLILKELPCGGLPEAIKIYNSLTANGFYTLTKKEIKAYFG